MVVRDTPVVSVILPSHNRLRFLVPAVESVFDQTFEDWQLVIADDGSAQDTLRYLRSIAGGRVTVIELPHSGNPSRVRNAAIRAAVGRYLAFLDSDDVWAPDKLARQLTALHSRRDSRWCYTGCGHIDAHGSQLPKKNSRPIIRPQGWIFEDLLTLKIGIAMPTVFAEKNLVDEVGGFDEEQRFGEFHDLCLRLAMRAAVLALDEPLCWVRSHDEHYSSDQIGDQTGWMRLYEKMSNLATAPHLVRYCKKMRAITSLKLAREHVAARDFRSALVTLISAAKYSWRFPNWWWGVLKGGMRLAVRKGD
jgi:glycosyltransferase involved in cell wall biosynthesis